MQLQFLNEKIVVVFIRKLSFTVEYVRDLHWYGLMTFSITSLNFF